MATSVLSPLDDFGLCCGPLLDGTPAHLDQQLVRHVVDSRRRRQRWHRWWRTRPSKEVGKRSVDANVSGSVPLAVVRGSIRNETAAYPALQQFGRSL
jgi:hypothetical protein